MTKGRTGVAERCVQTIRGLQKTLLCHVEEEIKATIPSGHVVVQWAAMHAAWLYNRFNVHATLKTAPFQSLWGRPYKGKVTGFGQIVFGLDTKAAKYKPAWRRGAWLGKDVLSDMDLISTNGQTIIRTKAIRKIADEQDPELLLGMTQGPMDFFGHRQVKTKQKGVALPAPLPQEIDEEAEALRDQVSDGYSASEALDVGEAEDRHDPIDVQAWEDAGLEYGSDPEGHNGTSGSGEAISPGMAAFSTPMSEMPDAEEDVEIPPVSHKHASSNPLAGEGLKFQRMDDDPAPTQVKAAKTEDNINQIAEVELCHNDEEMFDAGLDDGIGPLDNEDEYIAGQTEGEGPPDVSADKLKKLDEQAALDELDKPYRMEVIQPVFLSPDVASSCNTVDTTLVFDWRYRNDSWIRRCRLVAREFRTTNTDETSFAPTSAFSAVRMPLTFALIYSLAMTALDISDAFLMLPQVEVMFVEIPQWVRELTQRDETHWGLLNCLPGQRNAALRWRLHFAQISESAGLQSFPGTPTVMRHKDLNRRVFINVHVDDILLICKPEDLPWFQQTVGATLKMKVDGPHLLASGDQMMYLKKRITLKEDGILIQSNATYVPKLTSLLKVSGRRKKGLPHHATLESFSADLALDSENLANEQAAIFRSCLGLALYVAMDRPDIQFAVKTLSSYMSRPSIKAMAALKHLTSYLDGTPDNGVLLRLTEEGKTVFDFWNDDVLISDETTVPKVHAKSQFVLEAFSDSSWADCKSTRRSTSSGVIFLNGSLVMSVCRTQASVALSSCEAELYAANGLMVEALSLKRTVQQIWHENPDCFHQQFLQLRSKQPSF